MKHLTAFDMIYKATLNMSKQELLAYHHVIIDNIQTIWKLNPPYLSDGKKGELTDEMNQLLTDLFTIKKMIQDRLEESPILSLKKTLYIVK